MTSATISSNWNLTNQNAVISNDITSSNKFLDLSLYLEAVTGNQPIMEKEKKSTGDSKAQRAVSPGMEIASNLPIPPFPTRITFVQFERLHLEDTAHCRRKSGQTGLSVDMPLNEAETFVIDQFDGETSLGEELIQDVSVGRDALYEDEWGIEQGTGKDF